MRYIDAYKLIAEIERRKQTHKSNIENGFPDEANKISEDDHILSIIASLQQEPRFPQYNNIVDKVFGAGNLEGFEYREAEMLVALAKEELLKSLQQEQTPTEREIAEAHRYAEMIREKDKARIQQEQPDIIDYICLYAGIPAPFMDGNQWCILKGDNIQVGVVGFGDTKEDALINFIKDIPLQQEQPEIELGKFTEKIKTFQGRYKYPEILSIKGAMAFMARMFYQYPNVARQWYDRLPKTTMD